MKMERMFYSLNSREVGPEGEKRCLNCAYGPKLPVVS
jgi:hypothetical protein